MQAVNVKAPLFKKGRHRETSLEEIVFQRLHERNMLMETQIGELRKSKQSTKRITKWRLKVILKVFQKEFKMKFQMEISILKN